VRNDADAMGALFKAASFDVVEVRHNLGKASLRAAIRELSEKAVDADMVALFYAGHGIEVGQANYLIPVDARLATDFDVEDETLSLERALQAMAPAKRLRLVILDACRENPFIGGMKRTVAARGVGSGLARVEPTGPNTLIAFATKPNAIASDGTGPNSPFTAALLKHLLTPGLDLRIALGHVRDDVLASTDQRQEPYVTSSLGGGTIALIPGSLASISSPSSEAERAWASVKDSASIGQLEVIASHYEGTVYADLARARIEELKDVLRKQRLAKQSSEKESLAPPAPSKLVLPPPKRAEQPLTPAERLLSMGQKWLDQGNISAARAFLQRAADAGSADAALAMGTTYDPAEQTRLALFGVVPDRNEARKWYERARDLGSAEAETRLARLAQQ
jgi:hypothetical protein